MKKRSVLTSFQQLEATCPRSHAPSAKTPPAPKRTRETAPPPAIEDENALFLAAVAGSVDVSQKNPYVPPQDARAEADDEDADLFLAALGGAPPSARQVPPPAPLPDKELSLFARAMDGVTPINARGRDLHPAPQRNATPPDAPAMTDLLAATVEFALEYSDEFIQGHVLGLDQLILAKLRAGAYSPESHIDLHGKNLEQAYLCLVAFIKDAYLAGKRHLIIVTGRGKNPPGGTAILRERVQTWFTRDPFKRVILAFCSARPGDGGAGALYLLLRKRKKGQGKIIWDRTPSEEELFY